MKLRDFKALTFDCYGTLIDWETGIQTHFKPLTDRLHHQPTRDEILEAHGRYESAQQAQTPSMPYYDLLAVVYRRVAEEWGLCVPWSECVTYGRSVGEWPAFDDTVATLRYLKQHYKLIILSNVDNQSFAGSNEQLGVEFDAIYTAQDVGSYKPSDRNFDYMLSQMERLGIQKSQILHTAESLFHDHTPANRHGLSNCWIYRRHAADGFGATQKPEEMPTMTFRFNSMAEFANAHRAEIAGA